MKWTTQTGAQAFARLRGLGIFFLTGSWGYAPGFTLTPAPQADLPDRVDVTEP